MPQRQDAWSDSVQCTLLHVHDLPTADVVCHQMCSVKKKHIPKVYVTDRSVRMMKKKKIGRPADEDGTTAFIEVATFLEENYIEQIA